MAEKPDKWDMETEVLVVGTGGSALTAAILAHDNGTKVTVIEKSNKVGGATAVSGGGIWAPGNHHMESDSREDILKYCKRLTKGRAPDELIETYVDTVPDAIKYMEKNTPVELESTHWPDYHPEMEGAHKGDASRMLCPVLFNKNDLGEAKEKLRPNPTLGFPMTFNDMAKWESLSKPANIPFEVIAERMEAGLCGLGEALMGSIYKGCLDRGIDPIINTRAIEFIMEEGRVTGVKAKQGDNDCNIHASKAVILASGGFEWNEALKAQFLPGEITHPNSPPSNEGDGLKMAMAIGADLGNMSEIWGQASLQIPGEEYDGKELNRCSMVERSLPNVIIVNRKGERFVNEAASYNDMLKSFWILDPNTTDYLNLPAWTIFDEQYHKKYNMLTFMPGDDPPPWLIHSDTLEELAQKIGIDPDNLTSNIARFNKFAREGVDHDFHRGTSEFDQYWGDRDNKPNPNLGTIEKPPFYALPTYTGAIGTKGGPKINTQGQVLNVAGDPIPGLYAAGNVTAGVSGPAYWGGGGTIGPGMVFGYICGINAAKEK